MCGRPEHTAGLSTARTMGLSASVEMTGLVTRALPSEVTYADEELSASAEGRGLLVYSLCPRESGAFRCDDLLDERARLGWIGGDREGLLEHVFGLVEECGVFGEEGDEGLAGLEFVA